MKEKKNIEVELKGIEDRVMRLTPNSSQLGDAILSKSGDKLYYMASFEGGMDLWVSDLRSRSTKVMHKLNSGWASLEMDRMGKICSCWEDVPCRRSIWVRREEVRLRILLK